MYVEDKIVDALKIIASKDISVDTQESRVVYFEILDLLGKAGFSITNEDIDLFPASTLSTSAFLSGTLSAGLPIIKDYMESFEGAQNSYAFLHRNNVFETWLSKQVQTDVWAQTYSAIFVDFDNTLCLHMNRINYADSNLLFGDSETACEKWFKHSIVNETLIEYLEEQRLRNTVIILLSDSGSTQLEAKKLWVEQNCPPQLFSRIVATSIDCGKLLYIKSYMTYMGLSAQDILLIDDTPDTYNTASVRGICDIVTPQYIQCLNRNNDASHI